MAHKLLHEDTPRGEVAAFLAAVESAYPTPSRSQAEDAHLEAIFREARLVRQHALARPPATGISARARRLLSGALISCTVGAGAAVGVATAAGGGPFAHLLNPPPAPPSVAAVPSIAVSASVRPTSHVAGDDHARGPGRSSTPAATPGRPQTHPPHAAGLTPGAIGRQRAAEAGKAGLEKAAAARKAGRDKAHAAQEDAQDKPGPAQRKADPQPPEPPAPGKSAAARSRGGDAGSKGKGPRIDVPGATRSEDARAKVR